MEIGSSSSLFKTVILFRDNLDGRDGQHIGYAKKKQIG